jgi:hypothetical protein
MMSFDHLYRQKDCQSFERAAEQMLFPVPDASAWA